MFSHIYIIGQLDDMKYVKIGYSDNPLKRLKELQTANSSELYLQRSVYVRSARLVERALHGLLSNSRKRGEWFELTTEQALQLNMLLGAMDLDCRCSSCWRFQE